MANCAPRGKWARNITGVGEKCSHTGRTCMPPRCTRQMGRGPSSSNSRALAGRPGPSLPMAILRNRTATPAPPPSALPHRVDPSTPPHISIISCENLPSIHPLTNASASIATRPLSLPPPTPPIHPQTLPLNSPHPRQLLTCLTLIPLIRLPIPIRILPLSLTITPRLRLLLPPPLLSINGLPFLSINARSVDLLFLSFIYTHTYIYHPLNSFLLSFLMMIGYFYSKTHIILFLFCFNFISSLFVCRLFFALLS